ncbi:phytolongin Phyl1.1-like [Curcuma longa]|uniref:phytolongin Phyl1.1-like n=1 Tax=Curcuma longa TaxID=136217 RepID=UPI003D9F04D7
MNSRRSRSVKLVSSTSLSIEVELGENSPMNHSVDNTVYCCVAKGSKILYSYSGKDAQLESLAVFCLENAPAFHRWYFHSVGPRTFGFLIADGHTYFAIIDPSVGNSAILRFLEHIRDGFMKVAKNGFQDELMPIIQRLIESLENMPRSAFSLDDGSEGVASGDGSTSTKAPLLGKNWNKHHDRKKMKDKVVQTDGDAVGHHGGGVLKIDVVAPNMSLPRSSSSSRLSVQQGRRLWCRHVKIIIAVDVVICLLLFVVWLAVCQGFTCVS